MNVVGNYLYGEVEIGKGPFMNAPAGAKVTTVIKKDDFAKATVEMEGVKTNHYILSAPAGVLLLSAPIQS